jgi:hypothetical protein
MEHHKRQRPDHRARGLVMRIDHVPNFWIPESIRSRFEREDALAGVLGLHGWEMFVWHNWRRIGLWLGLVMFVGHNVESLLNSTIDGVSCLLYTPSSRTVSWQWRAHYHGGCCPDPQVTGLYVHLAKVVIALAPLMTLLLSLDSHICLCD